MSGTKHHSKITKIMFYVLVMGSITAGKAVHSVFTLIALGLITVYIFRCNLQEIIEINLVTVSFAALMFYELSISLINYVLVISVLRMFILRPIVRIRTFAFFCAIIAIDLLSLLTSQGESLLDLLTFTAGMIMAAMVLQEDADIDLIGCVEVYAFSLLLSTIVTLIAPNFPELQSCINEVAYRYNDLGESIARYSGLMGNPNYYTMSLNICISILLPIIISEKKRMWDFLLIILMIAVGILSLSKSFIWGLLFTVAFLLLYYVFTAPSRMAKMMLLILIGLVISVSLVGQQYIDVLVQRLNIEQGGSFDLNDYTTNRISRYEIYWDYLCNHSSVMLFGKGYGSILNGHSSHNIFLESLYFFGLIGTAVLSVTLFVFQIDHIKKGQGILRFLPLGVLLVRGLAINVWVAISLPYYIILIFLAMRQNTAKKPQSEDSI